MKNEDRRKQLIQLMGELSYTQFASMVRMSNERVRCWVKGYREIPPETMSLIVQRLGEQTRKMP